MNAFFWVSVVILCGGGLLYLRGLYWYKVSNKMLDDALCRHKQADELHKLALTKLKEIVEERNKLDALLNGRN